jgi:hypothetical protein
MRGLQLALIYANWAGSVFFGWLQAPLWLLVPVCAWASFAFSATAAIQQHQKELGVVDSQYGRMMFASNIRLIARNAGINFVLFAAAWLASYLFGKFT